MRIAAELYLTIVIGSILITAAGISALLNGERFNLPLAFILLGIVVTVGLWLMAIDASRTE